MTVILFLYRFENIGSGETDKRLFSDHLDRTFAWSLQPKPVLDHIYIILVCAFWFRTVPWHMLALKCSVRINWITFVFKQCFMLIFQTWLCHLVYIHAYHSVNFVYSLQIDLVNFITRNESYMLLFTLHV